MEIKRKFEMQIETNRRFVIRQSSAEKQFVCAECNEPMLTAEQIAGTLEITQRRIFQIIENNSVHFIEIETGATLICLHSIAKFLDETE